MKKRYVLNSAIAIALFTSAVAFALPARAGSETPPYPYYVNYGQAAYHPAPAQGYSYYQSPPPAVYEVPPPAFYTPVPAVYEVPGPGPVVINEPGPYYSY